MRFKMNSMRYKIFFHIVFIGLLSGSFAALSIKIINYIIKYNGTNEALQLKIAFFGFFIPAVVAAVIIALTTNPKR